MKSAKGNDRNRFDERTAEQYIENVLQNDRALLSGKHNPERSRARVMGGLAASAVPAVESAGASWGASTVAKLAGTKGIIGVITAAAVAGGIGLALLSTDAPQQYRPVPAATPYLRESAPSVSVEDQLQSMEEPESRVPTPRLESPASDAESNRTAAKRSAAIEEKETKQDDPATSSTPPTDKQTVEYRNSINTTVHVNPVTPTKK